MQMLADSEHFVYSVKGDFHDLRQETRLLAFFFCLRSSECIYGFGSTLAVGAYPRVRPQKQIATCRYT
ncbi:MAG: hypothetical protein J6X58_06260 [Bacteroidales bacterium]|nr:hypothetical protein [Bacteroidales bacterium]